MVRGHRSHKNNGHQHREDIPTHRRIGAGASHHVDSRHRLQQLRQFRKTFIDDIERAINRGKELGWDSKSRAIWEDQMWELNSINMERPRSTVWDALLDMRNRFLQPYIAYLEDELKMMESGSKGRKVLKFRLSRLKEEHKRTGECEDAKEFFDWYFSRETQEDSDNDSIRGRDEHIGRGTQNSWKETTSRNRDSSRDPYFGSQTRSINPSTSIRSQGTIGDSRTGDISGSELESRYGHRKYMVETYIRLLKSHITTAKNRGWTYETYSPETGITRSRYVWKYWEKIESDLQCFQYDDELFSDNVAEAWTEFLESYKDQLHLERKSYEEFHGYESELQRCNSRIRQTKDELAAIRKYSIFTAFGQFHLDMQPSDDTSAYEPRTEEWDSHSDLRYSSGIAKGHTRNSSQPAQSRSPTQDRYRIKLDSKPNANTHRYTKPTYSNDMNANNNASLDPKKLKGECIKYTSDCDKIAKDSLVCWERDVMNTGIELIRKLNEINPDSEGFYKELGSVMSKFIDWFIENANNELKSIEHRAKRKKEMTETHKDVRKSLNDLIKQGMRLRSKL